MHKSDGENSDDASDADFEISSDDVSSDGEPTSSDSDGGHVGSGEEEGESEERL